ncbi:MAG: pyruvate dehydrogenase (acetyl-transferring) E1 component subunit alpha [Candidatus Hodarchaeales archaeon]|jgi:pyruvate dehydrogenase E1 component alpha subunit
MLQILKRDGSVDSSLEPKIPDEKLAKMYEIMILVRLLDEKQLRLQRQGRTGFHISWRGQEATQVGAVAALRSADWIFPAYREPACALYRGTPIIDVMSHYFGNSADPHKGRRIPGLWGDKEKSYVTPSAPIGTQIIQAAGAGYAAKYLNDGKAVLVFFGDGGTSSGDFHSGINFGGVFRTPTIFFCQNNQYAISVPRSKQTAAESIAIKAKAYGIPGVQIDGNDILAVYQAVSEAAERAKKGEGPTLIEAITYRMGHHTSSDDSTRYRTTAEVQEWEEKDPIKRFEAYLIAKGLLTETKIASIRDNCNELINGAIKEAETSNPPDLETLFTDVYDEMPWHLREQLNELRQIKVKETH